MRLPCSVAAVLLLAACAPQGQKSADRSAARLAAPPAPPYLMFVSVASDDSFRRVGLATMSAPDRDFYLAPLTCERVYFSGRRGICLASAAEGPSTRWFADVFDERFAAIARVPLTGTPSRVRLSPDGSRAAATVFETGHAYDEHGFSTRTTIIDTNAGTAIGDLEGFTAVRDGQPFRADDFNYWGVTFAGDNDTFYATLQTGSVSYLVKGSLGQRSMILLHPGVECPSLSPDNSRIAFKKRVGTQSRGWWQLAVLSLDTLRESLIATETRNVDDQVEWLDDDRIAYHLTGGTTAADLWSVRVDSSAAPVLLRASAYSPSAVRQSSSSK
jgi:hypothetical protein